MKIKTQDLIDRPLDWAVAVAAGRFKSEIRDEPHRPMTPIVDIDFDDRGCLMVYVPGPVCLPNGIRRDPYTLWAPSTNWSQGGPIIEQKGITIRRVHDGTWRADFPEAVLKPDGSAYAYLQKKGPTPLIAANRCYVASQLGDEVDIPEELCK